MAKIKYLSQLRKLLHAGMSIRSIARVLEKNERTIRYVIQRHGLETRPFRLMTEVRHDLQQMLSTGYRSHREIARTLGIAHSTVGREAKLMEQVGLIQSNAKPKGKRGKP